MSEWKRFLYPRILFFVCIHLCFASESAHGQNTNWEVDSYGQYQRRKQAIRDSTLTHMGKRWSLEVSYGQWFFANSAKSTEEELFFFPSYLGQWQFGGTWHFSERWSLDAAFTIQRAKDNSSQPNITDVLAGGDISLEGGGGLLLPVELGTQYYLMDGRFRPLLGLNIGVVAARAQYVIAEGNITDGINRTDFPSAANAGIIRLKTGFDHRISPNALLGFRVSYSNSSPFSEAIGGYWNYRGWNTQFRFALLLPSLKRK